MKKKLKRSATVADHFSAKSAVVFLHGDAKDQLRKIPDESVKLIVTSPPYNVGKEYEKRVSMEDYLDGQRAILNELVRVLDKNGSLCWQVGTYVRNGEVYPLDIEFYQSFKERGLKLRNRIIWHYRHGLHATNRFSGRYETILWFTKGDDYVFNLDSVRVPARYPGKRHYKGPKKGKPSGHPLGKNPSDIWEIISDDWNRGVWDIPNVKAGHPEKTVQPCQFPVELVERCVLALSKPGDVVLDPFAGVASTLIAALKHKRCAIGIEKKRHYHAIGLGRIRRFLKGTLKLRPVDRPVYVPSARQKVSQIPAEWLKKREQRSAKKRV
jgi:adenine-specific DNA-methyltransferase